MDVRKGRKLNRPFHYVAQALKVTTLGIFILFFIFIFNQLKLSHYFPIKTIRIYGIHHSDQQEIETLITPLVKRGFFTVDVETIRDRLIQLPWSSDIIVERHWPDQVDIVLIEKQVVARWNKQNLLSQSGVIFTSELLDDANDLPQFIGPDGKHIFMLNYFNEMNRLFMPLRAKISYLELTPYFTWNVKLDNGITLRMGHKDILTRLNHFVKVYPKIIGDRAADVDYIDLRYPNGMAVRWKTVMSS